MNTRKAIEYLIVGILVIFATVLAFHPDILDTKEAILERQMILVCHGVPDQKLELVTGEVVHLKSVQVFNVGNDKKATKISYKENGEIKDFVICVKVVYEKKSTAIDCEMTIEDNIVYIRLPDEVINPEDCK